MEESLICSVCNQFFSASSELTQHQELHSKQELSQALVHLQDLLTQCRYVVGKLKRQEKPDNEIEINGKKRKHFLFDIMNVRDVNILFDNLNNGEEIDIKCKDPCDDEEAYFQDEDNIDDLDSRVVPTLKKSNKNARNGGGSKSELCDICQKTFSSKANLKKHQIRHTNNKPWRCDKCDKTFNQKRDYKYHMTQQHTTERPHVCKDCGKGFVLKSSLKEHIKIHTGERRFSCTVCTKRFQSSSGLSKHLKRHNDTKSFVCMLCPQNKPKSFKVNIDLLAHVSKVHMKESKKRPIKDTYGLNI